MVFRINKDNIGEIKNDGLRKDAERYVKNYDYFLDDIKAAGAVLSDKDYGDREKELLDKLSAMGAEVRNGGNSVVINAVSTSCNHCRTGIGSSTYIITLACNRDCFFCVNKNQADYDTGVRKIYDMEKAFKNDLKRYKKMKSAAITGGEPLLYPDKCAEFIKTVKKTDKTVETRIYTNGDLVSVDILKTLSDAGLDEIRFGLKPDDNGDVDEKVFDNLRLAAKYIKRTMVEMPLTPGKTQKMKDLMVRIDETGIFGVNILEFLYPYVHSDEYAKRKYEVDKRPYKILFGWTYAGGVPVAGSRIECLETMLFCLEKGLNIGFHYCSLENKLSAQIYHHNAGLKLSGVEYFSPNDFFIKTVKGYGDDVYKIQETLDKNGCRHYLLDNSRKIIEFSPKDAELLKDFDMELGLAYLAADFDEQGRKVLKELQIDKIEPRYFSLEEI